MAHIFCNECKIGTRKSCAKCSKMRQKYIYDARSALTTYETIKFMGEEWVPLRRVEKMREE